MMKNLVPCFTLIKRSTFSDSSPGHLTTKDLNRPFHSVSKSAFRNFNSLFDYNADYQSACSEPEPIRERGLDSSPDTEPDFAAAVASQRFFFASPGRSNSIIGSCPSNSTVREDTGSSSMLISPSVSDRHSMGMEGGGYESSTSDSVAVHTYSPDPYADFRRSMEEMVEARGLHDAKANWEKLHELLLCYLALNPKSAHRYIVRAFADLLVTLMSSSPATAAEDG